MQNPIQKFRQNSIVFKKLGSLCENLKTWASFNYPTVQYFLLKHCTRFLLTNVYKRVSGIFLILFRSWVINKNVKRPGFYALVFYPPYKRLVWDYKKANIDAINMAVKSFFGEDVFNGKDINSQVDLLNETLMNNFSNFIPRKVKNFRDSDPSWMNNDIKKS